MSRSELTPPRMVPSRRLPDTVKAAAGAIVIDSPSGGAPTATIVPPLRVGGDAGLDQACALARALEGVVDADRRDLAHARLHVLAASGRCSRSRPSPWPRARRAATGSTAMMRAAPAMRAPCTTERPMPPRPSTSTVAPSSTLRGVEHRADARLHRAADHAHDVERHVLRHAHGGGLGGSAYSAKPPTLSPRSDRSRRVRERPVLPSGKAWVSRPSESSQCDGSLRTHQ